jgi:hypothetical protein
MRDDPARVADTAMNSEKVAEYEVPEPTRNAMPFEAGEHGQVAVKVIDDRGNELIVVSGVEDRG